MSCGCTDCACKSTKSTTEMAAVQRLFKCEVYGCHRGPDANVYTVRVHGPDGRQRTAHACVAHLDVVAARCLSGVRLEPFEDYYDDDDGALSADGSVRPQRT